MLNHLNHLLPQLIIQMLRVELIMTIEYVMEKVDVVGEVKQVLLQITPGQDTPVSKVV